MASVLSTDIVRLFLGIPLPAMLAHSFSSLKKANQNVGRIRWVQEANLHITTCFIGDTTRSYMDEIIEKTKKIIDEHQPFVLNFDKLCIAPKKEPYMIWARYQTNDNFAHLSVELCEVLLPGKRMRKNPIPHVTLGRFKKDDNINNIDLRYSNDSADVPAEKYVIWESVRVEGGVVYKPVEEFRLL